jgi:hypothetical protein
MGSRDDEYDYLFKGTLANMGTQSDACVVQLC